MRQQRCGLAAIGSCWFFRKEAQTQKRHRMNVRMKNISRVALFCLIAVCAFAGGNDDVCNINFTVLREYNGKPVRNASIVIHPVDKNGKQKNNGVELKADNEGKASFPALPYGKVRIQVLAPGLQTFGEDYIINEKTKDIEVKLKKPQGQYSIYEDKKSDKTDKGPDKPKDEKK